VNKSQLVEALASKFEGNKKAAAHALDAVLDTITREVARGEKVAITGFGAFEQKIREARIVRNPQTGELIEAAKKAVPKFTPGADLRNVISGAKQLPAATVGAAGEAASGLVAKVSRKPAKAQVPDDAPAATKAPAAKKAPATKKTSASATTATKAPATAKKSPAKKAPATAKKSPAKKAPATANKTTAKKASATAKKTTVKKTTAKKTTANKTTAKKAPATAKKATATKAAPSTPEASTDS